MKSAENQFSQHPGLGDSLITCKSLSHQAEGQLLPHHPRSLAWFCLVVTVHTGGHVHFVPAQENIYKKVQKTYYMLASQLLVSAC